jgi:hypothetical protein
MMTNLNIAVIYYRILTLNNVSTVVNYRGIFITLAQGAMLKNIKLPKFYF